MPAFRRTAVLAAFLLSFSSSLFADSSVTKQRTVTKLAEGVYEIRHPDAPDTFPQGNTTVVIGERSVLVVDSCLLPSSAKEDIEQIKKWTDKPVTFLVNTHWHFDHTLGNATYAAAFPEIQIIAHQHTRKTIADYNPGAVARYPGRAERFNKILDAGKDNDGHVLTDTDRKEYEQAMKGLAPVVAEMKGTSQLVPNIAFDRELDIDLGNRPVQLKFLGRANTGGDTVIYLPKEKIVMTGDILDHPVPYFFGGFPLEFPKTLWALSELDAETVVPGHGDVLHDKGYIKQVAEFLNAVNAEVEKEVNDNLTLEEAQNKLPQNIGVKTWRQKFVGNSEEDGAFFDDTFSALVKASYNATKAR